MDINVFPTHECGTVLRALRTALRTTGELDAAERSFLATYALICHEAVPASDPVPIAAGDVFIQGARQRRRLVQLAAMAALLARPLRPESVAYVHALAEQLQVQDGVLAVLRALLAGRRRRVRLLVMRRGMPIMLKEAWRAEGAKGVLRYLGALLFKAPVNRDQLPRFKRLGLLPEGTLGREYWRHMTEVGFNFPGEPGGIPSVLVYHDLGHVLAGHSTTGAGEIQQGCFQGGSRREDGFAFVQFVLLHFHHGVRIAPASPPEQGHFDPRRVLWAIHRGASCNVDMTSGWDFWPLMPLSLAEAARAIRLPGAAPVSCNAAPVQTAAAA